MPTQVQFRRGTTAQNQNFTGASGEISIDTEKKTVVVHDGSTAGGNPLAPNSAFNVANAAYNNANSILTLAQAAFDRANSSNDVLYVAAAYNTANSAYDKANNALANTNNVVFSGDLRVTGNVFVGTSTVSITNNSIDATTITVTNLSVNGSSIPPGSVVNLSFDTANAAFDKANAANVLAYDTGIGANGYAVSVGISGNAYSNVVGTSGNAYSEVIGASGNAYANLIGTSANNYAGSMANSANAYAASLTPDLSPPFNVANAAFDKANAANVLAYNTGIGANAYATDVGTAGNAYAVTVGTSGNNYVNSTFVKLTAGSQTITGDFSITGNLFIGGNTTAVSANNLIVNDPLIYLANNNITDTLDIGFVGSYYNVSSAHVHTGLYRDHSSKKYYLFQGYDGNPDVGNEITPYSNNMVNATLVADLITSNLNLGDANAIVWIKSAYDNANAAYGNANSVATSANNYAGAMANAANSVAATKVASVTGTVGQIYSSGGTTPTVNLISTGVTATTYGGATQIPVIVVDAFGRLTSASNAAVQGMDYAYANTIWGVANGKVETVTSNSTSRIWANTVTVGSTETVYVDLATSGVTATIYGGATQIPVITVDAYGRLTSASNVAVSGMDYPYVNTSTTAANNYLGALANTGYAAQEMTVTSLSDASGTIAWNTSTSRMATVTMSGTGRTFSNPTNLKAGSYILIVKQDATGSRTITTWGSAFKWPAAVAPVLSTTASTTDVFSFWCDGTNLYGTYIPDCR